MTLGRSLGFTLACRGLLGTSPRLPIVQLVALFGDSGFGPGGQPRADTKVPDR